LRVRKLRVRGGRSQSFRKKRGKRRCWKGAVIGGREKRPALIRRKRHPTQNAGEEVERPAGATMFGEGKKVVKKGKKRRQRCNKELRRGRYRPKKTS